MKPPIPAPPSPPPSSTTSSTTPAASASASPTATTSRHPLRRRYTYDANRFRLTRLLTKRDISGTPVTIRDLNYTYDAVGNITAIEDDAQQTEFFSNTQVTPDRTFTYDALYRLIEATGREKVALSQVTPGWSSYGGSTGGLPDGSAANTALRSYTQTYDYDQVGNFNSMAHSPSSGSSWTRNYQLSSGSNQLEATSIPGSPSSYSDTYAYNKRGAMTYLPHLKTGTGITQNVYRDFRDHLRSVDLPNTNDSAHYVYDSGGQRVAKRVVQGANTEVRVYLGPFEVYRKYVSGTLDDELETLHLMDGEQRVAMAETVTLSGGSTPGTMSNVWRYQLTDHLGTACMEVDESGSLISYEEYHPYGTTAWYAEASSISVSAKRYRYTGMERDEETGLQYHSQRYLMCWLGRWERVDPAGIAPGINRLRYARCNPVGFHDQSGLAERSSPPLGIYHLGVTIEQMLELQPGQELRINSLAVAALHGAARESHAQNTAASEELDIHELGVPFLTSRGDNVYIDTRLARTLDTEPTQTGFRAFPGGTILEWRGELVPGFQLQGLFHSHPDIRGTENSSGAQARRHLPSGNDLKTASTGYEELPIRPGDTMLFGSAAESPNNGHILIGLSTPGAGPSIDAIDWPTLEKRFQMSSMEVATRQLAGEAITPGEEQSLATTVKNLTLFVIVPMGEDEEGDPKYILVHGADPRAASHEPPEQEAPTPTDIDKDAWDQIRKQIQVNPEF